MNLFEAKPFEALAIQMPFPHKAHSETEVVRNLAKKEYERLEPFFDLRSLEVHLVNGTDDKTQSDNKSCTAMLWVTAKESILKLKAQKLSENLGRKVHVTRFKASEWPEDKKAQLALLNQYVNAPEIVDQVLYDYAKTIAVLFTGGSHEQS